jgi:cell wall-associated NlpC family hydrolase
VLRRGLLVTIVVTLLGTGLGVLAPAASAAPVVPARTTTVVPARTTARAAHAVVHRSAGRRIVTIAKRYVGKVRYRNGGETPRQGFDCSGYTKYAYARAKVGTLPHNTEAQRHARGMRRIKASRARPGDLVFYLSGGSAYHVAIYAGHHMQYAATTPGGGIRYQPVYSSHVVYGTNWH